MRSWQPIPLRGRLPWLMLLGCYLGQADASVTSTDKTCKVPDALQTQVSPQGCDLCIKDNPLLLVGADGTASTQLRICNKGAEDKTLQLSVTDFSALSPLGTPFGLNATRILTAESPSQQDIRDGKAPLRKDDCIGLKLEVSRLNAAGAISSALWNRDTKLIDLQAIRYHVPFNLKVDGDKPDAVTLALDRTARTAEIKLRNEDTMAYCVTWQLELNGHSVGPGNAVVPANGIVDVPVTLPRGDLQWLDSGFLRSATWTGRLFLRHEPDASFNVYPMAQKIYPVTAHMSYYPGPWQKAVNSVFILLLLLTGIVASLLISHALPMQRRRVAIKQRLADLEGRLAGLGELSNQRVMSLLRIDKRRLRDALRQLWPITPSVEASLEKLETRVAAIETRIDLTVSAGECLAAIRLNDGLSVLEADAVRSCCRDILEVTEKALPSEDDLKTARAQLQRALELRAASDAPPSELAIQELRGHAQQIEVPAESEATALGLKPLHDLFDLLRPGIPDEKALLASRAEYVRAACVVAKAKLIDEYFAAVRSATAPVRERLLKRQQDLIDSLTPGPDESIALAKSIVSQVIQNISVLDVIDEIKATGGKALRIDVDPPTPIPLQLVILRVRMERPGLDASAARTGITCQWTIDGTPLEETGWTIGHYFEQPEVRLGFKSAWLAGMPWLRRLGPRKPIVIGATLSAPELMQPVALQPKEVQLELQKSYLSMQLWLSLTSILITLVILGLGLRVGAQEKLQTLDWISGAMALIGLGFGADVIKQLLAKSS